jgi:hypothetical protein
MTWCSDTESISSKDNPYEIRTECPSNTGLEGYRYTEPLGVHASITWRSGTVSTSSVITNTITTGTITIPVFTHSHRTGKQLQLGRATMALCNTWRHVPSPHDLCAKPRHYILPHCQGCTLALLLNTTQLFLQFCFAGLH